MMARIEEEASGMTPDEGHGHKRSMLLKVAQFRYSVLKEVFDRLATDMKELSKKRHALSKASGRHSWFETALANIEMDIHVLGQLRNKMISELEMLDIYLNGPTDETDAEYFRRVVESDSEIDDVIDPLTDNDECRILKYIR